MKSKGFFVLFSLLAFLLMVSLACNFGADTPAAPTPITPNQQDQPTKPIQVPTQPPPSIPSPTQPSVSPGGLQTFTDQNNLYKIQLPSDWVYKQVTGDNYYIDQFKSPDGKALVENIVYNDGSPFSGSQHGKFALNLLNEFYSNTGEVGDIRVTGDQIQADGSERLEWTSKSGGYSGFSYFEVRKPDRLNFLMLTIEWMNSAKDQYIETLDAIIESYRIP